MPTSPSRVTSLPRLTAPAAVLWDMDGTLIDSEPYWIANETGIAAEHGAPWTEEQALQMVGRPITDTGRALSALGVPGTPDDIADELVRRMAHLIRTEGPPWRPGARELLDALRAAGIPCALVTMSYREMAQAVLDTLPEGTFEAVVTGDEVTHGKPHPEPYLAAARALGVEVTDCVAIEDSPTGVRSAVAAGVPTLAVPHVVPVPAIVGAVQAPSLRGLTPHDLRRLFVGARQ